MKTKKMAVLIFSLVSLLFVTGNAFAAFELNNYASLWMTNANGVVPSASQATFNWNEQPWLYIRFNDAYASDYKIGGSSTSTMWTWDGTPTDKSFAKFYLGKNNDLWIGFSKSYWENTMRQAGDWTVSAMSLLQDKTAGGQLKEYGGIVNFHVNPVPEPVSMILFLTGAATLAARTRMKKA
jgi:hypothetical protein